MSRGDSIPFPVMMLARKSCDGALNRTFRPTNTPGWGNVTRSEKSDKSKIQVNVTRDSLMSAPEFKRAD
jgi:hypothetical protein